MVQERGPGTPGPVVIRPRRSISLTHRVRLREPDRDDTSGDANLAATCPPCGRPSRVFLDRPPWFRCRAAVASADYFTGRGPLSGTAAPPRHLSPDALPAPAWSADEPDGAHAAAESTEQSWSSPLPPSLAFMEEPWRAKLAAPLLSLLIPGRAMRVSAYGTVQIFQISRVRPQNDVQHRCCPPLRPTIPT